MAKRFSITQQLLTTGTNMFLAESDDPAEAFRIAKTLSDQGRVNVAISTGPADPQPLNLRDFATAHRLPI
jgi:hypothetical protein